MEAQFDVRLATLADAGAISQLVLNNAHQSLAACYTEEQMRIFDLYYSVPEVAKKLANQITWLAESEGQLLGTISLDGVWMVGFYTEIQHIGKGIGFRLLQILEAYARGQGLPEIRLAASPVGVTWYLRYGYSVCETKIFNYFGVDFEETEMVKHLGENHS